MFNPEIANLQTPKREAAPKEKEQENLGHDAWGKNQ